MFESTGVPVPHTLALLLLVACDPAPIQVGPGDTHTDDTHANDTDSGDPTGTVPFVADVSVAVHEDVHTILLVSWTQVEAATESWVEYSFGGEAPLESPRVARPAGPASEVLLGIPADTEVVFRIHTEAAGTTQVTPDQVATTGSLPSDLPVPDMLLWDEARAASERWLLGSLDVGANWYYGPYYAFILDRQGRYVWYWKVPDNRGSLYVQPGWDGTHIFVDANTAYVFDDVDAGIFRMSLDLHYLEETVIDYGFAIDEHVDGGVLFEGRVRNGFNLTRRNPDGTDTLLWECKPYFDSIGADSRRCNPNTLVWDADRNTVLWSMYVVNTVLEIDLATGEVIKQFGQLEGGWTFDPEEATVDYQHYVNWTPAGTLIASTHTWPDDSEQRTREYQVDEASQTLHEIWTFGAGVDHYAQYAGEAWRHPDGNTLIGYGVDGVELEVSPDGAIVWDVEWPRSPNTHLIGHMTLVDDLYALNAGH